MTSPAENFDLETFLTVERGKVERAWQRVSEQLISELPRVLAEPIRYALDAGGKRLRPIICVASYRAVSSLSSGDVWSMDGQNAIYEIAVALELIHTYSLIHDDLPCMDDDDLRRGRPTTHRVFGVGPAMAAGAALIPVAAMVLENAGRSLGLTAPERMGLVTTLAAAAGASGMVAGQWLDLEAEGRSIGLEELETVHRRKTGALLVAAALLGGQAARADAAVLQALANYGQAIGLAFQIADDILDLTGDVATLGKTAGRDLSLGKATYPALMGLEAAHDRARAEASRAIDSLSDMGLDTDELIGLASYAVEREL